MELVLGHVANGDSSDIRIHDCHVKGVNREVIIMSKIYIGELLFFLTLIIIFVGFCYGIVNNASFADTRKREEFLENCLANGHSVDECERLLTIIYYRGK